MHMLAGGDRTARDADRKAVLHHPLPLRYIPESDLMPGSDHLFQKELPSGEGKPRSGTPSLGKNRDAVVLAEDDTACFGVYGLHGISPLFYLIKHISVE